jgi:hypothetical protein
MIRKAQKDGLITGLAGNIIPYGVAILQYAKMTLTMPGI